MKTDLHPSKESGGRTDVAVIEALILDALKCLRVGNFYATRELLQEAKREVTRWAVRPE